MANLREASRETYRVRDSIVAADEIKNGCLQRIADSLERMEKPYLKLIADVAWYKTRFEIESNACKRLNRRIAALKGQITKMRKQGGHR